MVKTLIYILGSRILENPYIIHVAALLLIASVLSMFTCRLFEKGTEKKRLPLFVNIVLIMGLSILAFYLLILGSNEMHQKEQVTEAIEISTSIPDSLKQDNDM